MDKRSRLKMQGYEQAMRKHGLVPQSITTEAHSSFTLGSEQLRQALARFPALDGVFCTNDDLAIGALFECQRLGIPVPQQIKIAGFHGHDVGQSLTPQLASVMTPRLEIGRVAAQELLDRIHGISPQSAIINLGYNIHLGESV